MVWWQRQCLVVTTNRFGLRKAARIVADASTSWNSPFLAPPLTPHTTFFTLKIYTPPHLKTKEKATFNLSSWPPGTTAPPAVSSRAWACKTVLTVSSWLNCRAHILPKLVLSPT